MQDFMVVATLMLGVAFSMVVQSQIPDNISKPLLRTYTVFLGSSLFCLFVSLWFAIQLQHRLSSWMSGYVCVCNFFPLGDAAVCRLQLEEA